MKKKKLLACLLSISFLLTPANSMDAKASDVPSVDAKAYVVLDAADGDVLLEKNSTSRIYPASTAKLLTAVTALDNAGTSRKFTTTTAALSQIPSDASQLFLPAGCRYNLGVYLNMLLISSSADAASTIANGISGSTAKFVAKMNKKAKSIGMKQSHFDNPMGFDSGSGYANTYSTAADMAKLARYAMSYPTIRKIVKRTSYSVNASGSYAGTTLTTTNKLLKEQRNQALYTIVGSKTGSTGLAGKCLIATAIDTHGHEVICAYFGASSSDALFDGVTALLDYIFTNVDSSLDLNFYDTRYIKEKKTIKKYATAGILTADKNGAFHPEANMTELAFSDLVSTVSGGIDLPLKNAESDMTALRLARYLAKQGTISVSSSDLKKYSALMKEHTDGFEKLKKSDVRMLAAMYANNVMTISYGYNVKASFNKAQTVTVGKQISRFMTLMS